MKKCAGAPSPGAPVRAGHPDDLLYNSALIELPPESTGGDRSKFNKRIFKAVQAGPVRLDDLLDGFRRIDWSAVLGQVKIHVRWGRLALKNRNGTTWISRGWRP